jgi:large subunit ribosomal protein L2
MSVRKLKPITPGQRFRVVNGFDAITTDKPERSLIAPIKNSGGRNSQGKMTMRYTGWWSQAEISYHRFQKN